MTHRVALKGVRANRGIHKNKRKDNRLPWEADPAVISAEAQAKTKTKAVPKGKAAAKPRGGKEQPTQ